MNQCQCLTANGKQCGRDAAQNSQFCWQHKNCQKLFGSSGSKMKKTRVKKQNVLQVKKRLTEPGKMYCPELEKKGYSCYFFHKDINAPTPQFIELVYESTDNEFETYFDQSVFNYGDRALFYLKDNKTNKIIGTGVADILVDELSRKYNSHSYFGLHPQYQGKGLCQPFAKMVWCVFVEKLGIQYLLVHISSNDLFGACRCFVGAALSCGLRCFIGGEEVFNKDDCASFDSEKISVVFTNGIDLDQTMIKAGPIEWYEKERLLGPIDWFEGDESEEDWSDDGRY
jgi:hypothetical protein